MKNSWKLMKQRSKLVTLWMLSIALVFSLAPISQAQQSSAPNSPDSVIRADEGLIKACAEAVEELKAARVGLAKQGRQIDKQNQLLAIEKDISAKAKNINLLNESEKSELRKALAAKDRVIASVEDQNRILKKKRFTLWKAVKVAIVAGAAGYFAGRIF